MTWAASLLLAAACGSPVGSPTQGAPPDAGATAAISAPTASPRPDGWAQLVEAARQEAALVIYGPTSQGVKRVVTDGFERAFPGIKVEGAFLGGSEVVTRVMTERTAGRYIPDVIVNGSTTPLGTLKPAGAVVPLEPALVLPEVLDRSAWLQNRLWWADAEEPYTTLSFQGILITPVYVNTALVKPTEFTSYWDLLDPKWKGKIVSNDIRQVGPGGVPARFIYKHPQLGPQWYERLYSEMDITLSRDQRQMVDWLAQGRFQIAVFIPETEAGVAMAQGLPVAPVHVEQFKEGGPIGPGPGATAMLDRGRHPNAAMLFVNWLLSREGQMLWQRETSYPSLRIDIPKDGLAEDYVPKPGHQYVDASTEEYGRITGTVFGDLIGRALERAGR
jgi:iron(III) transport system substrate-binding protein